MRESKIKIKVGSGAIRDLSYEGFYLMESDTIVTPPFRDYDEEDFPEKDGVSIDSRTTYKAFDYKVKLLCLGDKESITDKIIAFYNSFFTTQTDSDIKTAKVIYLENYFYGVKMEGYAKPCNPEEYLTKCDGEKDAYIFDFILRIANPKTFVSLWS